MYTSNLLSAALLATSALAAPQKRQDNDALGNNQDLISQLTLAATAEDRVNLLKAFNNGDPRNFVYDFNDPPANTTTTGAGGHTVKADRKAFPALIGTGVSMTLGFIDACGFNTPHTHPRSAEINVVVQGRLGTQHITENGVDPIGINMLEKYQMTVFPQGATHLEFNPDCTPAVFVAGFASEDPGVEQSAQTLFKLRPDLIQADLGVMTLNGESIEDFRDHIPANIAQQVSQCVAKCGIKPAFPNQGDAGSGATMTSGSGPAPTGGVYGGGHSAVARAIRQGLGESEAFGGRSVDP